MSKNDENKILASATLKLVHKMLIAAAVLSVGVVVLKAVSMFG